MINPDLYSWDHISGRDKYGDRFHHHVLSHIPTTRVLAKVYAPCEADEYVFRISFFYGSGYKGRKLDRVPGEYQFMSVDGAKAFVEGIVLRVVAV